MTVYLVQYGNVTAQSISPTIVKMDTSELTRKDTVCGVFYGFKL